MKGCATSASAIRASVLLIVLALGGVCAASSGDQRLIEAVKNRDLESVRALLKEHPAGLDVNATQGDGSTALHWAVHRDDAMVADLLIRAGAHANVANDLGVTPLHLACTNRSAAMVERLLAASASPRAALPNGASPSTRYNPASWPWPSPPMRQPRSA